MNNYDTLNPMQREAVFTTEGPLLVLAGAGSGKTRALTHRVAYLIEEKGVKPWNILAITFTNKAAGEMRDRVNSLVEYGADSVWVSTFHSLCVRILRRFIENIGYTTDFSIYDSDDTKTLMKQIFKDLEVNTKVLKERGVLGVISSAKNEMISPEEFMLSAKAEGDSRLKRIAELYMEYQKRLKKNNALDFDDLLVKTVELFQSKQEVLEYYQDRFRYIMVDEYQDTNTVQFKLVSLLAGKYQNLCVVGDDDQSIYKFRGANIMNILNFEKEYPNAKVIKLEQNYRSTSTILNAANEVIRHNTGRKEKSLWTENGEGEKIQFRQFDSAYDEADYIVSDIKDKVNSGKREYKDFAILYRTNAQSRIFEEKMVVSNVPYKIVGGVNFYARREIKDLLAYLKTVDNGKDDLAVRRIINVPKRGIGLTTIGRVQDYATEREISFYEAILAAGSVPGIGRALGKIESFAALIEHFKAEGERMSVAELMDEIIDATGYVEELQADSDEEAESRLENIEELRNKIVAYEESCEAEDEKSTLSGFLEQVALVADIDSLDEETDYVVLMTLHSAKGLEFPHVYLAGLEDGIFPSYMTITADDPAELEEERRLCYVGITRAKENLTLTCARRRMVHGETQYNKMSRFLKEIPLSLLSTGALFKKEQTEEEPKVSAYRQAKQAFATKAFAETKPAQQFTVTKGKGPGYDVGDRVRHIKFGEGLVTQITEGGRDYEVTVDFDTAGTKKMFAMFAKLQKID